MLKAGIHNTFQALGICLGCVVSILALGCQTTPKPAIVGADDPLFANWTTSTSPTRFPPMRISSGSGKPGSMPPEIIGIKSAGLPGCIPAGPRRRKAILSTGSARGVR
jgi:hypothetical protein